MADHRIIDRPARAQRAATPVGTHVDIPAVCTELVRADGELLRVEFDANIAANFPLAMGGGPGARRGVRDRRGPTVLGAPGLTVPGWVRALGRDRRTRDMNEIDRRPSVAGSLRRYRGRNRSRTGRATAGVFIAAVPCVKMLTAPGAPDPLRFLGWSPKGQRNR